MQGIKLKKKIKEKSKSIIIVGSIAGFLLFFLGLMMFISYSGKITKEIKEKRKDIKNYSLIAGKRDITQVRLEHLRNKRAAFNERLLSGRTPAVAAAELQSIVSDMASDFGLVISSKKIITPKTHGIFLEVPVQITTQCRITDLKEILYRIETYSKLLGVSNLDIRGIRRRNRSEIKATIHISGFILNQDDIL